MTLVFAMDSGRIGQRTMIASGKILKSTLFEHPVRTQCRDVAQPGRALAWGARGRQFKSARPDQTRRTHYANSLPAGMARRGVNQRKNFHGSQHFHFLATEAASIASPTSLRHCFPQIGCSFAAERSAENFVQSHRVRDVRRSAGQRARWRLDSPAASPLPLPESSQLTVLSYQIRSKRFAHLAVFSPCQKMKCLVFRVIHCAAVPCISAVLFHADYVGLTGGDGHCHYQ